MTRPFLFALIALVLFCSSCPAQLGVDNPFWSDCWSDDGSKYHEAVVRVTCSYPGGMFANGSGVYVDGGFFLTANHVVDGSSSIRVTTSDGQSVSVQVKRFDSAVDYAVLIPVEKINAGAVSVKIATRDLKVGERCEVCGFAGGGKLRHFFADVKGCDGKRMVLNGYVIQGDSGGPIFNSDGELVSVVSGGVLWHNEKIDAGVIRLSVTTPIIGPDVRVLGASK